VKPQEATHDAAICRMYQPEVTQGERRGVLSSQNVRPNSRACTVLKVVGDKIPLPDLRIEYETAEGDFARVDLGLATEHYRGAHAATKAKAGFKIYADSAFASRLNTALTYGHSAVCEGRELTAVILSL
jgi:hypothetical protein